MCPVLLLFLLQLNSESTAILDDTGMNFATVFPENIAYYHPHHPKNKIRIIALYDSTVVNIKPFNRGAQTKTLNAGEAWEYSVGAGLELGRSDISERSLQVTSNNKITVHATNLKQNSMQTTLVTPAGKLSTEYLIPPVPKIEGTTEPADKVTSSVAERSPFKLIIVNGDDANQVIVEGAVPTNISLEPNMVAQIWLTKEQALRTVKTSQPVAVLFGHICAIRYDCACGQLLTTLPPAKTEEMEYYIPPFLANDAEGKTFVLLSTKESTQVTLFDPDLPLIKTSGTAVLYRPGLLLTLIPNTDFAACYVINIVPEADNFAVIVVDEHFTDGIHNGSLPLQTSQWQRLKGTDYVWTAVALVLEKNFIWHAFSKMAVYFVGKKEGALFGNPAPIISTSPDFRGCALIPEVVKIGAVADGWRESLNYCKGLDLELISLTEARFQRQVYKKLIESKDDSLQEVWIGMRRSSRTGEWYWLSKDPVNDTNWAEGEPGMAQDGQCAIMSLERGKNFGWSDESCCKQAHPVCYRDPVLLNI